MDLPQPPSDQDLRNIIDKLAQFVARNGPEFEHMTKTKQTDNPKFSFLFGGEFYHYYTYKVGISVTHGSAQQAISIGEHIRTSKRHKNFLLPVYIVCEHPQRYN